MFLFLLFVFILSFLITLISTPLIINFSRKHNIGGRDVHKKRKPFIPGLGGIAIVSSLLASFLFSFFIFSSNSLSLFFDSFQSQRIADFMLSALIIVIGTAVIGLIDDFISIPHKIKLVLPILISIPLVIQLFSWTHIFSIPFLGPLYFIPLEFYIFILVPIGMMAVTNVTNTFAGYNGLEAGLAAVISFFLILIGFFHNLPLVLLLSVPLFASCIAFLFFNWYPAKVFIDDVGTLTIGSVIATTVIIGGLEVVGFILLLPHIIDFIFFKVPNKLPSLNWWGTLKNGKLYHKGKAIHLGQFVLSKFNGLKEYELVSIFILFEIILGVIAFIVSFF